MIVSLIWNDERLREESLQKYTSLVCRFDSYIMGTFKSEKDTWKDFPWQIRGKFLSVFSLLFSSIKIVKSLIQDRRKRSCELYQWMSRNMKERCYFHVPYNILDLSRWCYMCVENDWNDPSYQSNLCDSPA